MRLHAVTMMRDEEDIVEAFVRHTLRFVDTMHLVIHQCMDNTSAIVECLRAEGLPIRITASSDAAFRQGTVLSALARSAFADGADIVFVLDADEFLLAPPRPRLDEILAKLAKEGVGGIAWRTYVPMPTDDLSDKNVPRRITHRPIQERKLLGKIILGTEFMRDEALCLLEGSHWLYRKSGTDYVPQAMEVFADMHLAHFPIRSVEQAVAKLLQRRWQRRIAWVDEPIAKLVASGWRSTFDRMTEIVLARGSLTRDELAWFAFDYSGGYDAGHLPLSAAFAHDLVLDPLAENLAPLRYADRIGSPCAALYRWLDSVIPQRPSPVND